MFVPVIRVPLNVTAAFAVGTDELVGPFQKRSAFVTDPVGTPVTPIVPVPLPRMPPKPNLATSALETVS